MEQLKKELAQAKESCISSWIDSVSRKMDLMEEFFKIAEKTGLVVNGYYISGVPTGTEEDIDRFYKLEDKLDYPKPQKI